MLVNLHISYKIVHYFRYPFYGLQFHPEKTFEWLPGFPHSTESIKANRYFMDFFVGESRKSNHHFKNATDEYEQLIYNYLPSYTAGLNGSYFQQTYFFEPLSVPVIYPISC